MLPPPIPRDKLRVASDTSAAVFGNLEELHDFHGGILYPELERCGANPAAVARAFVENCPELRALYSDQCRNMHSAHRCELRSQCTCTYIVNVIFAIG